MAEPLFDPNEPHPNEPHPNEPHPSEPRPSEPHRREPSHEEWQAIQQHLFSGQMIQAIKIYRSATGQGLKESKDAMEAYADRLRRERPEHFSPAALEKKRGCAGVILLVCGLAATAVAAWV